MLLFLRCLWGMGAIAPLFLGKEFSLSGELLVTARVCRNFFVKRFAIEVFNLLLDLFLFSVMFPSSVSVWLWRFHSATFALFLRGVLTVLHFLLLSCTVLALSVTNIALFFPGERACVQFCIKFLLHRQFDSFVAARLSSLYRKRGSLSSTCSFFCSNQWIFFPGFTIVFHQLQMSSR